MARLFSDFIHRIYRGLPASAYAICFFAALPAGAQSVECRNIRQCSTLLHVYEVAAEACRAEMKQFSCDAFRSNRDLVRHMRTCAPEAMCEERRDWNSGRDVIPGCTGITAAKVSETWRNVAACYESWECLKKVPAETVRNLGRMAVAAGLGVWDMMKTAYRLTFHTGETIEETNQNRLLIHRAWVCLDNQYKYRMMCELAGGTFAGATAGRALVKGAAAVMTRAPAIARSAGRASAVERLNTRTSVVEAREAAGRGVRPAAIRKVRNQAATALVAGAAGDAAGSKPRAKSEPAAPAPQASKAEAQREGYIRQLLGRQNTTVEQRRAFAELAYKTRSDGHTVFLDLQNSKMKYLNDHLGNKNVVTAVTNRRLEMTFDQLKNLKTRYPQLETLSYDDFKSGRLAFRFADGRVPSEFMNDVNRIMKSTDDEYIAELGRIGVIPEGSDILPPETWFASGTGRTGDQANAASRYAARTGQATVDFWSPVVRKNLEGRLGQTDTYRSGLMKSLRASPLTEKLPNGELIPSTDVFEAYRKSTNAGEFARLVNEKTGQTISVQTAQGLRQYLSMLDEWSTGLLIVEPRQAVSFSGSKFNGVTIDVSGMGALNMRELARSLVGVRDIDTALVRARAGERSATEIFERNKAAIVEAARTSLKEKGIEADVRVSGDDIIVLPLNKALDSSALEHLHEAIARSPSSSNVRLSAVASGVAKADQVAVLGETLEKRVRGFALQTVPDPSRYTLMVVSDGKGRPRLKVAARSGDVTPEIEDAFQAAFRKSLESR